MTGEVWFYTMKSCLKRMWHVIVVLSVHDRVVSLTLSEAKLV